MNTKSIKTSIIIPHYNEHDLLKQCIQSIKQHTETPYEIIVVDNGSQDGSLTLCRNEAATLLSLPHNVGFPQACNLGLSIASGDALLLLNNDVIVTRNWLTNMLDCLYSSEQIGVVGPMTNFASGAQQIAEPVTNIEEMTARYNTPNRKKWMPVRKVVGLCFLFKRRLMDEIGVLDERFSPGHYEDDDYCYRARQAGYEHMLAGDVFVYHQGNASFRKLGEGSMNELIIKNRQKFIEKWGIEP